MKNNGAEFVSAACKGKLTFLTFSAAKRAADRGRHSKGDRRDQPYHCKFCHKFHVGPGNKSLIGKRPKPEVFDERDYAAYEAGN